MTSNITGGGSVPRGARSAYGELLTAELTPIEQLTATYDTPGGTDNIESGSGTVSFAGGKFSCSLGTTPGSAAGIRGVRQAAYRAGQGVRIRMSARWPDAPVADALVAAGLFNGQDSIAFGYVGPPSVVPEFSCIHRHSGALEVRSITVTTPAAGAESVTVTLDGTAYVVPVTAGTLADNAREIAAGLRNGAAAASWVAEARGAVVFVRSFLEVAPRNGTYSVSSTGALVAATAQVEAGVTATIDAYPMSAWNRTTEPFAGFDPSMGNVYVIALQFLGNGPIVFAIEDPATGDPVPVHVIEWGNVNEGPSLTMSILSMGYFAQSLGSTTDQTVEGSSMSAFVEGRIRPVKSGRSHPDTATMTTGVYRAASLIRSKETFGSRPNLSLVRLISAATSTDATRESTMIVIKNATDLLGNPLSDVVNFTDIGEGSLVDFGDVSTAPVSIDPTSGQVIGSIGVARQNDQQIDLAAINEVLNAGDTCVVAIELGGGSPADFVSSFTWIEDV